MKPTIIIFKITFSDTFFSFPINHEFAESLLIPGILYNKNQGFIALSICEQSGAVSFNSAVLGLPLWSESFNEAGTHSVDLVCGSGSIKGTITLS